MRKIRIFCRYTNSWVEVPKGSTLEDVYQQLALNLPFGTTSCLVNNRSEGLHYTINDSRDVEFLDVTSDSGLRTYTRSLFFVLYKAVHNLFPGARLRIGFMTWQDFREHKWHLRSMRLQTKVVLSTTAILLAGGFLYFFLYEFRQPQWQSLGAGVPSSIFRA